MGKTNGETVDKTNGGVVGKGVRWFMGYKNVTRKRVVSAVWLRVIQSIPFRAVMLNAVKNLAVSTIVDP